MVEGTIAPKTAQQDHGIYAMHMLISQRYTLLDAVTVWAFLRRYPELGPVLVTLSNRIPTIFPASALFLQIVDTAYTRDAPDGRRLVLFIATDLEGERARVELDRLMAAWKPDVRTRTGQAFSIELAYGTTTAAVETATERFARMHSIDWKAHRELSRRLLYSEPGSLEEGVARAEFTASLANEEDAATTSGGDAFAVLARLRRQAGTQ